ncbi:MAG TPA: L,D-transpeptidase family protein [Alphaproteobacteria bacterium]|nr:L,D-transpeptidase family protein [Alphaproteobacteria bacterium]
MRRLFAAALTALFVLSWLDAVPALAAVRLPPVVLASLRPAAVKAVREAYEEQGGPLWLAGGAASQSPRAIEIRNLLRDAGREGLVPDDYWVAEIDRLWPAVQPDARQRLDALLTVGLLHYLRDLRHGRVPPAAVDPKGTAEPIPFDDAAALRGALQVPDLVAYAGGHAPANPVYRRLRHILWDYRAVEESGGWPAVPGGPALKPGMEDARVAVLRRRLIATGDLGDGEAPGRRYDGALVQAVRHFQRRHGLADDGIVGPATLAALNVPVAARIRQLEINMERWRWMPDDLGERYILVNLAGFELEVVELDSAVLRMRVVVGRDYRRTPVFSDRMTYLDFNPTWTVPPSIARKDILPKLRRDPGYLAAQHLRVLSGWDPAAHPLDPATIDWRAVSAARFPYKLVQAPWAGNALGRVKFVFPNRYNVYMHDTPERELFERSRRAFSSGCIRLQHPLELAWYLLQDKPGWDRARIDQVLAEGRTTRVILPQPIPVHLTYSTAWLAGDGTIEFRDDIYGRDATLAALLYHHT